MRVLIIYSIAILLAISHVSAGAQTWQPSPGHEQISIWPGEVPDALVNTKPESTDSGGGAFNVSHPTMTLYKPSNHNTGIAMVVFPGGGYQALAMKGEGADVCDWL